MPFGVIARSRFGRSTGHQQGRLTSWQVYHAEVREKHPVAKSGPEGFGSGFLGREPFGEGSRPDGLSSPQRSRPLGFREYAIKEAVAVPLDRFFDASDVTDVGADAEDHRPAGADVGRKPGEEQSGHHAPVARSTPLIDFRPRSPTITFDR